MLRCHTAARSSWYRSDACNESLANSIRAIPADHVSQRSFSFSKVENEFGHLRTDGSAYLGHLVRKLRELGIEVPLITSDGMDPRQIYW